MSEYTIKPVVVGTITRDTSHFAYQLRPGTPITIPIFCFYITDGKEHILVDTGPLPPDGVNWAPYTQTPDERPDKALARIGISNTDINKVILTHLHWDHASNNALFPNAVFYTQKEELRYAAAPIPIHRKSYDRKLIFQTEYEILDGDVELLNGLSLVTTPGHSPGSQSVLVNTSKGKYIIVGDLVDFMECWERVPKVANGYHTDLIEVYKTFDKVEKLEAIMLTSHEPKILEHSVYPV